MLNGLRVAEPEARQPIGGEEEPGDLGPPCHGSLRFRDGAAEKLHLGSLYRMLNIPVHV
jgi:hypothetical protein